MLLSVPWCRCVLQPHACCEWPETSQLPGLPELHSVEVSFTHRFVTALCCLFCFPSIQVLLRFNAAFHNTVHLPGRLFNVRFAIKRTSFVFMHEALDVAQRGTVAGTRSEILLPSADARGDLSRKALVSKTAGLFQ